MKYYLKLTIIGFLSLIALVGFFEKTQELITDRGVSEILTLFGLPLLLGALLINNNGKKEIIKNFILSGSFSFFGYFIILGVISSTKNASSWFIFLLKITNIIGLLLIIMASLLFIYGLTLLIYDTLEK